MDQSSTTTSALETGVPQAPQPNNRSTETSSHQKEIRFPSDTIRTLTNTALKFLSNASNETLGACAIGLCASTYLVLGRAGLVLIGTVGGIVLHATWEASNDNGDDPQKGLQKSAVRRKELGIEIAKRLLDWKDRSKDVEQRRQDEEIKVEASIATTTFDYSEFQPATAAALTTLTDAIIRDYVKWWYCPILPSETNFPLACRQTLTSFILSISNHLSRKRPADAFLDFLTNSTSIVIVFLSELSTALRVGQGISPEEAIYQYLKDEPDSNLANVLSKQQQERKLGLVADDILENFLDTKALNFPPSKTFLREIFAGVVLESIINTCSKPEWINGWIVYLLQEGESEIINVIEAGVSSMENPTLSMPKSPVQFDEEKRHARRISRAEEAMQEAMLEAKRLSEMIAEEDARKRRKSLSVAENEDAVSTATTEGMATPTSSESDFNRYHERSLGSSIILQQTVEENTAGKATSPKAKAFTDFDQLAPLDAPTGPRTSHSSPPTADSTLTSVLTLHKAAVTIMDDGDANDKSTFRSKPAPEYLLQIEPAISKFAGWMIVRRYQDFETLHEVLRRISVVSGTAEFAEKHSILPTWKGQTKQHLRQNLERYLQSALKYETLAESEAMKKFLEKETGLGKVPRPIKNVFPFQGPAALENMGKGLVNALGQAPKGLAGGGKAVLGGVQGVFGAVGGGLRKPMPGKSGSISSAQRRDSYETRASQENIRVSSSPTEIIKSRPSSSRQSTDLREPSRRGLPTPNNLGQFQEGLHLPPPPAEIADDYVQSQEAPRHIKAPSISRAAPGEPQSAPPSPTNNESSTSGPTTAEQTRSNISSSRADNKALSEEETRASIELIFAIITELYTLSSAWTIRLSLLSAAKTFLLRPQNPQLESIRLLLQDSVIDAHLVSDRGLAAHILKLRENTLPTEEERRGWPREMTEVEREELRVKARKFLVERGMPQALTSVMGSVASGEALGRVFDCLQVERVARGLVFALLLQVLRAMTQ